MQIRTSCESCLMGCTSRAAAACKKQAKRDQRRALRDFLVPPTTPTPNAASAPRRKTSRKPGLFSRLFSRLKGPVR